MTFSKKPLSLAILTSVGFLATPFGYAQTDTEQKLPQVTLDKITVTATRTPTLTSNTIAQTLVINEEQLQRYQGQSVLDVLKNQVGFSFNQSGGQGTMSNFYLRGYDGKQILVLIDGIRYSSMSTGVATLNLLPADQIDRIEILYGASGSSLYGADAMGGVIQVFTKGQFAKQTGGSVTLGAGTQNSYKAQATGQYVNNGTTLSLSAGHEKTDGINATSPSNSYGYHSDKDGFERDSFSLVVKHQFNQQLEAGLTGLLAKSITDYDNGSTNNDVYADQENGAVNAFVNYKLDKLDISAKLGQSVDNSENYANNSSSWIYKTKQQQANLQLNYKLPAGQIIAGAEHLKQDVDAGVQNYNKNRNTNSGFIGYQLIKPNYDFQAHIRHDSNSQYGDETTYNLGTAYRISPDIRLGASYATGFRVPTFNDLYFPSLSNLNLIPETSKNIEFFAEYQTNKQNSRLTGYHSNTENLIISDSNYIPQNISKTKVQGVSLTSDWQVKDILFGFNYDYQQAKNTNDDTYLPIRPKNKGLAYVGYRQPEFDIRAEVQHIGKRYNYAGNMQELDKYTIVNISGNYYLNKNLTINGRINNLTDKEYQTNAGYNSLGINSMVAIIYQF